MIGKTRMGENHINRLMPTEMFDWKLKILILARTQVTDQALGGACWDIGTKCHRRTDNNGAQLLFVL